MADRLDQIIAKLREHAAAIEPPGSMTLRLDVPPEGEGEIVLKVERVYKSARAVRRWAS